EKHALEEELDLGLEGFSEPLVEEWKRVPIRLDGIEIVEIEPAQREIRDEAVRARIVEHPPDLSIEHVALAELAGLGEPKQLVVGPAAPEEEGEARRELDIAQREPGFGVGPRHDPAVEEIGAREHGRDEVLDAFVEAAGPLAAGLEERHQAVDVVRLDRPAERSPREMRENALGTGAFFLERLRLADGNLVAARRARPALRLERPFDLEAADDPRRALLARVAEAAVGREAVNQLVGRNARAFDERHDDLARAGLDLDGNIRKARHDR